MKTSVFLIACLSAFAFISPAHAHHGKDFLLVETADTPSPGNVFLISSQEFIRTAGENEIEFEPAILVGVTPRLAFEIHSHIVRNSGGSVFYEATAPAVHYVLTPEAEFATWRLALSAEYEIASHRAAANNLEGRFIVSRVRGNSNVTANVIVSREQGAGETGYAYAIGFRPDVTKRIGWGLEAQGDLRHGNANELLIGFYGEPTDRLTVKAGLGAGIGDGAPDLTVRTGLVIHF